jgi:ABC-type dipeptide/oligopeptide/nickel transport system permease component/ABC-type dipeptide/oligopeptide/nickel transport system permease subunit
LNRLYRVLTSLGVLLASTVAVFALLKAYPDRMPPADQPVFVQYFAWLFRVLRGDLGWSTSNAQPVSQAIVERLPATIELAFFGFMASVALGALAGFVRARARAPVLRDVLAIPPLVGRAIPVAILALSLQLVLMFTTKLPAAGSASGDTFDMRDWFAHLVEPVLALALPFGAWSSSIFYDFFRAPDAASRRSFRDIAGGVAMTAALIGPALLSASLLVEAQFAWPGIARLFFFAVHERDAAVFAGVLLMYSVAIVLIKLCSEFSPDVPHIPASRATRFSAIGVAGLVVLSVAAFAAVTANLIAPSPYFIDMAHWVGYPLAPGVDGHLLGTDENGRDLFARLLFGLRTSLGIAAPAAVVATAIGAFVAWATKSVRWFDERGALGVIGIRPFAALPFILIAVTVLAGKFHTGTVLSPPAIALMIAAVSWPAIVPAFRTLTPATLGGVVHLSACALLLEVTMSMHGFGVQPPVPSLGNMLANALSNLSIAPWIPIVPTLVIVVTLFALYALGDELRERGASA